MRPASCRDRAVAIGEIVYSIVRFLLPSTAPPALGGMSAETEAGAKSALDPHVAASITPFVVPDHADLDLTVANVTTVKPERTFWDKIMILHGLRQWYDQRGELRSGDQRVSRHYYDVNQLLQAGLADA